MSADTDLLAMLDASATLVYYDEQVGGPNVKNAVYWGYIPVIASDKVINVPLPYLVYNSSPGRDNNERFCGNVGGRVGEFDLKGVGSSERQAKWVLDEARKVLNRKRLGKSLIKRSDDNLNVRRDDDFTASGGDPVFYGVDRYAVAV